MLRRILFPVMLALLSYGLWVSPDFGEIAAGVSIFLFGMLAMEEGFKALTGGVLEGLLARTTDRLWKSVCFGIVTTAIMQSSSLVSVVTISFLGAGMISLGAGIGIIFGANLGTTTGAWLIAGFGLKVSISAYAMPLLIFGIVLVLQPSRKLRGIGYALAGLGFLFLGIHYMKEGFEAFQGHVDVSAYQLPGFRGLVTYVLLGILATVVMQSSHATLVLTITALAGGQIGYDNALAIAIGSNVGTTVTAIIGALGANIEGKRLALAHLLFNLVTAAIAIAFMGSMVQVVAALSRHLGIAADDFALQLAVFHSLFNLVGVLLMLPFTRVLVRTLERILSTPDATDAQPMYLNTAAVGLPDVCVEAVRKENLHLLSNAFEILAHGIGLHRRELLSDLPLAELVRLRSRPPEIDIDARYERTVKPLFGAIVEFISRVQGEGNEGWMGDLFSLRNSTRQIVEAVKGVKHLNKNLSRHMNSSNELVRAQYDRIRIELGEILRLVARLRAPGVDVIDILALDELKPRLTELDSRTMMALAEAIRQRRVPAAIATSIMNDAQYAKEVGMDLLDVMQVLSSVGDRSKTRALDQVGLQASEVQELGASSSRETAA